MRQKVIEKLKECGHNAIEENGTLMIIYDGPEKLFDKVFQNACTIAKSAGYTASIGIRNQKVKEGEES